MKKIKRTSLYSGDLVSYCVLKCIRATFSDIGLKMRRDSWTALNLNFVPKSHKGNGAQGLRHAAILNKNSIFSFLAKDSKINMQLASLINGFG